MRSYSGIWINTDKLISITKIEGKKGNGCTKNIGGGTNLFFLKRFHSNCSEINGANY